LEKDYRDKKPYEKCSGKAEIVPITKRSKAPEEYEVRFLFQKQGGTP
jgi:hypothetical protein